MNLLAQTIYQAKIFSDKTSLIEPSFGKSETELTPWLIVPLCIIMFFLGVFFPVQTFVLLIVLLIIIS